MGWLLRLAGLALAAWALIYGLRLRDTAWTWSAPIQYRGDITNAFWQGRAVLKEGRAMAAADNVHLSSAQLPTRYLLLGFVRHYDSVVAQSNDAQYSLDYTPARLLVMTFWARYVRRIDPQTARFPEDDAAPLLRFNTGCELAAALFMFLLVRHWARRGAGVAHEWGWLLGLIAALICWFNPSTLLDAHMWPQWDVWIVPFYLASLCLASIEWWFAAGMTLAIGAMFKGQLLMVAPVLAMWPLFGGRWWAAARIVAGFFFAAAIEAAPWLARNAEAWEWIGSVLLTAVVLVVIGAKRSGAVPPGRRIWPIWSAIPIAALVVRPGVLSYPALLALALAVVFTPLIARHLRRGGSAVWLAGIATICVFLAGSLFAGSWSWFWVGFEFPARHYMNMTNGAASNLPAILGDVYHWRVEDIVGHIRTWPITMKSLLVAIYASTLVLCAAGAAIHSRHHDARSLIALTAPWVLMFTILPQMHERYLVWGAAVCGVAVACSWGMSLLHVIVIGLSTACIARDMRPSRPDFFPGIYRFIDGTYPGIGWMLLLIAAIYLFVAVMPYRRPSLRRMSAPADPAIDFTADRSYAWDHANQASETLGPSGTISADQK